ncbi:Eco57I restriction-modification methylase domain-containing protein [Streptomyces sp. NPDC087859]|uniref:Eco57I restriction-modification methylase domain-containing protein n=1 Tax=Streptomyces sp. NPDC087859 TaxID=3365812 RepID=UPI0037FA3BCD
MATGTTSARLGFWRRGQAAGNRPPAAGGRGQHEEWLGLVTLDGPFLGIPALTRVLPQLDALDGPARRSLRLAHREWQSKPSVHHDAWIDYLLRDLLGWEDTLSVDPALLGNLSLSVPEHQETLTPSFALISPDASATSSPPPGAIPLLGLVCAPDVLPTGRQSGAAWAASPADRLARLCRHHDIGLGLVTAGRWCTLVWAPREAAATYVTFDTADWGSAADRTTVRAFISLLSRRRFFSVPDDETLTYLLSNAEDRAEDLTESLGQQVKEAVELLVAAIGRRDREAHEAGRPGLEKQSAAEVYKAALATQMRILFAFFAEEKGLLPADNPLYARSYSAGGLCTELEAQARDTSEEDLEQSTAAWHRLVALFHAIYQGVDHPDLQICGYDGSLFDPGRHPWLEPGGGESPWPVDDRTVLHMLRAVQYVTTGRGRQRERRRTTFAHLRIGDIGSVYEGLLEYEGQRAAGPVIGLIGKQGREVQVELAEVERHAAEAARAEDPLTALAASLSTAYKSSGIGTATAVQRVLRPLAATERAATERKLLAATGGDTSLVERLRPFYGIIRHDLRGLPLVILPGGLYVGKSSKRKATGAHYTPEWLAAEVVEGALEPLVYSPGPLETADRESWRLKSSADILRLKVADIACGSGAFLVAACRYLAERLVEARAIEREKAAEGRIRAQFDTDVIRRQEPFRERADEGFDLVMIRARRKVAERCLYGVDINPLAVELAKFALWLDTVEPGMPFTFLDDRLIDGDSLVGISRSEQVDYMHMLPTAEHTVHRRSPVDYTSTIWQQTGMGADLRRSAELRESLIDIPGDSLTALAEKRRVLRDAELSVQHLEFFGELLATASLAHAPRGTRGLDAAAIAAAAYPDQLGRALPEDQRGIKERAQETMARWRLAAEVEGFDDWRPINWPHRFPEVFQAGGFDAIVGNPPFLGGQKLTGALGKVYREYLVQVVGHGTRGSADLAAYFVLRAHELLNAGGQTGLLATNTLAQGDTREVGLDQLVTDGVEIRQSIKSAPWPSRSAVLEYCAVWTSRAAIATAGARIADGVAVKGITSSLDVASRVTGTPRRLAENQGIAFQGAIVLGLGFTMEPAQAQALIAKDERNREVLFPYLNGQDLNSRPDGSASRWVINFHNWSEERARQYPEAYEQVRRLVKPERDKNNRAARRERWWQYAERAKGLHEAIQEMDRVLVLARISKTIIPLAVSTHQVLNEKIVAFASEDAAFLALLSSASHYWWSIKYGSTMKSDLNYSPSDAFETFPLSELTQELSYLGSHLDAHHRKVLLARGGLTATYNFVHDEACTDPDIAGLRAIHQAIDEEVAHAYGWHDLVDQPGGLDHGFHDTRQGPRYTIGPVVRQEILDRLLEENQRRYQAEVNAGLHPRQESLPFDESSVTHTRPTTHPASKQSPQPRRSGQGTGPAR